MQNTDFRYFSKYILLCSEKKNWKKSQTNLWQAKGEGMMTEYSTLSSKCGYHGTRWWTCNHCVPFKMAHLYAIIHSKGSPYEVTDLKGLGYRVEPFQIKRSMWQQLPCGSWQPKVSTVVFLKSLHSEVASFVHFSFDWNDTSIWPWLFSFQSAFLRIIYVRWVRAAYFLYAIASTASLAIMDIHQHSWNYYYTIFIVW